MAQPAVPNLKMPQTKLEKLADDLKKLDINPVVKVGGGAASVPAFQRQGYLEKMGHARMKWFKRFFVLRDSFLLSYNLQKSDFTVEPRSAVHLGNATIQVMEHAGKPFCFMITTMQKDRFLFSAETEEEREAWVRDLEESKQVTHANMIKLAVENHCLAEEKGASAVARDNTVSALAVFSNEEYIKSTPVTGGAEGWLRTLGFNPDEQAKSGLTSKLSRKDKLQKCYFILRDSHLLMFHGGDILTKPRGVMYLLGTHIVTSDDHVADKEFHFTVRSSECGDEIVLVASSNKVRNRWTQALKIGSRVTYPDYSLLKRERDLLASVSMTPRAARPEKANQPAPALENAEPVSVMAEDLDIQGEQLDPATQQPFDEYGTPLLRDPEGKLTHPVTGEQITAMTPRYGAGGEQLDPFNRPLPPGAVPMFTESGAPIGVGPDGEHYTPDGEVVDKSAPHFDADGNKLEVNTVQAADAVSTNINVAIKARAMMKGENHAEEAVDVLGRSFRELTDEKSIKDGKIINKDGDAVPLKSARKVEAGGKLVQYEAAKREEKSAENLAIKIDNEGDEREIGSVEIDGRMTLKDVRQRIAEDVQVDFPDFVFLLNGAPLLKYEEAERLATGCLPEIVIRGKEVKVLEKPAPKFNKKIGELHKYEEEKKKEKDEFADMMARIREGKFLRSTKKAVMED